MSEPNDPRQLPAGRDPGNPPQAYGGNGYERYQGPLATVTIEDETFGLEDVWRIARRRALWIVVPFVLVVAATAWYTLRQTPIYQASSLIRIEGEAGGDPASDLFARGTGYYDYGIIETEMRVISTQPILERAVDSLDLHVRVTDPEGLSRHAVISEVRVDRSTRSRDYEISHLGTDRWQIATVEGARTIRRDVRAEEPIEIPGGTFTLRSDAEIRRVGGAVPEWFRLTTRPFGAAVGALAGGLSVNRPNLDANLVRISVKGTDPHLVAAATDAVATAFIDQRRVVRNIKARSTVQFLREQTADIEEQLQLAETDLLDFREARRVVAPQTEAEEQVRRLAELEAHRSDLVAERATLRNLIGSIEQSSRGARPDYRKLVAFPTFLGNSTVQDLVQSLTEVEQRRAELRARFTEDHPDIIATDKRIEHLEERLGNIGRDYLGSLNDQVASMSGIEGRYGARLSQIPSKELELARRQRETGLLADLHTLLETRLKEAQISEAIEDPSVRVVEPAVLPASPISPQPRRNLAFGAFLGLALGFGLAFMRDHLDKTIRSEEDVNEALGIPVLSRVPRIPLRKDRSLISSLGSSSLPAESYRTLRTNVRYARAGEGAREILVTSPGARDGKSVTAANLAVTFAQQGRRTVLIDADMRRSVQHEIFEISREPGLSDLLSGETTLENVLVQTDIGGLLVLPAGNSPPNPAELLGSRRVEDLLHQLRERFDHVIVDSPPVLAVTDAAVLASRMEGVLLVVRADQTHRAAAEDTLQQMSRVNATVLGVVVNDARASGRYGHNYSHYYRYYGEEPEQRSAWKRFLPFS